MKKSTLTSLVIAGTVLFSAQLIAAPTDGNGYIWTPDGEYNNKGLIAKFSTKSMLGELDAGNGCFISGFISQDDKNKPVYKFTGASFDGVACPDTRSFTIEIIDGPAVRAAGNAEVIKISQGQTADNQVDFSGDYNFVDELFGELEAVENTNQADATETGDAKTDDVDTGGNSSQDDGSNSSDQDSEGYILDKDKICDLKKGYILSDDMLDIYFKPGSQKEIKNIIKDAQDAAQQIRSKSKDDQTKNKNSLALAKVFDHMAEAYQWLYDLKYTQGLDDLYMDELEERYTKRCQAGDFKTANALVGIRAPAD